MNIKVKTVVEYRKILSEEDERKLREYADEFDMPLEDAVEELYRTGKLDMDSGLNEEDSYTESYEILL